MPSPSTLILTPQLCDAAPPSPSPPSICYEYVFSSLLVPAPSRVHCFECALVRVFFVGSLAK